MSREPSDGRCGVKALPAKLLQEFRKLGLL
jgi:hypothetical protein